MKAQEALAGYVIGYNRYLAEYAGVAAGGLQQRRAGAPITIDEFTQRQIHADPQFRQVLLRE